VTLGPVDFIALEFPGNKFKGDILPDIFELVDQGIVRVFDLVIIVKDQDGSVVVRELHELDEGQMEVLDPLHAEVSQMITVEDINKIAEKLEPNSTAGLMLIENLWAKKTQQAMIDAGGKLVMFERIPHDVVEEALADIAALASA
jgi:uncharacterized membrane protein